MAFVDACMVRKQTVDNLSTIRVSTILGNSLLCETKKVEQWAYVFYIYACFCELHLDETLGESKKERRKM